MNHSNPFLALRRAYVVSTAFLVTCASCSPAAELVPVRQGMFSLKLPKGWLIRREPADGALRAIAEPGRRDSPIIVISVTPLRKSLSFDAMLQKMLRQQGMSLELLEERALEDEGRLQVLSVDDSQAASPS